MPQGSFNRRKFLKHSLAGMALIGGALVLGGCNQATGNGLQIVLYPDPRLRMLAEPVKVVDQTIRSVAKNMAALLVRRSQWDFFTIGALHPGLAAPQIGLSKRLIVCGIHGELQTLINPEIVARKGRYISEEKCLSLPSSSAAMVQRSRLIKINYRDLNDEKISLELRGRYAALVEHEIDHLNGVLYTDY